MPGLLQRFLPREEGFFDLFTKQAVNINAGANALLKMLSHYTGVPEQVQIVKAFEHEGDDSIRLGTLDLAKVLVAATSEMVAAVRAIETPESALKHCIEINRYENESDRLCRTLIAQLFDEEKDSVQIIKWKEIFEVIETAVDKCEDVANVIEGVILKSA